MKLNLNNADLTMSAGRINQFPNSPMPQITMSGRSNVGKSSLINSLLNRKSLARVSSAPGKTITVNFYDIDRRFYLVDLPGYGYAKRTAEEQRKWSQLTDGYFTANPGIDSLKLVLQLVDSKVGLTKDDCDMLYYLSATGIPFAIVATKCDRLNKTELAEAEAKIMGNEYAENAVGYIPYSAKTSFGRDKLWTLISEYANIK